MIGRTTRSSSIGIGLAFLVLALPCVTLLRGDDSTVSPPPKIRGAHERLLPRHLEVLRGTAHLDRGEPSRDLAAMPTGADRPTSAEAGPALVWKHIYKQGNYSDLVEDMVVGPDKAVYVTGTSGVFGPRDTDAITIKILPNGRQRWRRRFRAAPGSFDRGEGVAIDSAGNVYVAGGTGLTGAYERFVVLKYTPAGRLVWRRVLGGEELGGAGNAFAVDVVVDAQDTIYVTGRAGSATSPHYDLVLLKLDPFGNELWRSRFEGRPGDELPKMLRVGPGGKIVVMSGGWNSRGGRDWITLRYSPEGRLLWKRRNYGRKNQGNRAAELAIGDDSSVHVVGYQLRPSPKVDLGWDFAVVKYSASGSREWRKVHRGRNHVAWAVSVDVDAFGNVFAGGRTEDGGSEPGSTGPDFITIKYDSEGRTQWKRTWVGLPYWNIDDVQRVRATGDGGVIVAGKGIAPGKRDVDYIFQRYSTDGVLLWTKTVAGPGMNDFVRLMELDDEGGIYASGHIWDGSEHDIMTVKLQQ